MKIWHTPPHVVFLVADIVGVEVGGYRIINKTKVFCARVKLKTRYEKKGAPYRRFSGHQARTVPGALCWHGFRDFFTLLFESWPTSKVQTTLETYDGQEDFLQNFEATRMKMAERYGSSMGFDGNCSCFEGEPYAIAPKKGKWRVYRFDGEEVDVCDTKQEAEESAFDRNELATDEERKAAQ